MKRYKVVGDGYLPTRLPYGPTALAWLALTRFDLPLWARAAGWTLVVILWIECIGGILRDDHCRPRWSDER
jgi:hypothetical protein